MPRKAKTVRMAACDYSGCSWLIDWGWIVRLGGRWLSGCRNMSKGGAKRSGTAWARREYGPDVVIEWE